MQPQTSKLAYLVVGGQLVAFLICVCALCGTLFYKNYSDPVVLTALISLTSILAGNLGSILGGPRMMQLLTNRPQDVIVKNDPDKKDEAIPVTEPTA